MSNNRINTGSLELWGTFSVRDHLADYAFVSDVLLYDRLVIPTLPKDGDPDSWPANWNLQRQKDLLEELGELAIEVPWTEQYQSQWQKRFDAEKASERALARSEIAGWVRSDVSAARAAADDNHPYWVTRMVLADHANKQSDDALFKQLRQTGKTRPGSTLEAVAAYTSFDAFNRDIPTGATGTANDAPVLVPSTAFGWNFFVPAASDKGEAEHLRSLKLATGLARRPDFVELRGSFYRCLADFDPATPPEEARVDMERRLNEYTALMRGQKWKTWTRRAIKIGSAFSGLLGFMPEPAMAIGGPVFAGAIALYADHSLPNRPVPERLKGAAMFHDAREHLGWKP